MIMLKIKNCLFATALLSLALASGCAKGGNGIVPPSPNVSVSITSPADANSSAIYPGQAVTLTAVISNSTATSVTWSLSGGGAIAAGANSLTETYTAPSTATSGITVTATLVGDTSVTGTEPITVIDVTTAVSPSSLTVGSGLTQQFTAVALPNDAPQMFTWTCTVNGATPCANFSPAPGVASANPAVYTAADSCTGSTANCVQISAASTLDPTGCSTSTNCTVAKVALAQARVNGSYAFQFSGYDNSNNATAIVGTFTVLNGTISSGYEDELTSSGPAQHTIAGGSYDPVSSSNPNSNNSGTLTLTTAASSNSFQVVLDGNGDLEMIEADGHGTGSGVAQKSSSTSLFTGTQTYAFGFTGVDSTGNRIGIAGVLPTNGSGTVTSGQMDANDNGNATNICGAGPCALAGTYTADSTISGLWHMILTSGSLTMNYDFFIASGTGGKTNPLTFYAISTSPIDNTHPAISGPMVLQDSTQTYNNAAFDGASVSALTGVNGANTNVSLTLGSTDGNGDFSGQFDQNNAGTILSSVQFPSASQTTSPYTYAASGTTGRYTFNMLGNPGASPTVAPIPFVLYASGANRGFLLDQSSSSVMTGIMNPAGKGGGILSGSEMTGTFAAATTSSADSGVDPLAANLLLTWANTGTCTSECLSGTEYQILNQNILSIAPLAGAYTLMTTGNGTIALTAPSQSYVIYVVDTTGACSLQNPVCAIQDFLMIDEDKTNPNPSIIFAKQ
jgi:hypothetical protein